MAVGEDKIPLNLYKKGKRLGKGGVGTVKEYILENPSEHPDLPAVLAVKTIRISGNNSTNADKFVASHEKIKSLTDRKPHANLVKIYDIQSAKAVDNDEVVTRVIMERLQGDLKTLWKDRTLTALECSLLLGQILAGLDYLHNNGIMHRDVKPSNVLLQVNQDAPDWKNVGIEDITVKIADYDFARIFETCMPGETKEMTTLGTRKYMPPEIREAWLDGNTSAAYTDKSDIFAVGALFYEMLMHSYLKDFREPLKDFGDMETRIQADPDIEAVGLSQLLMNMCCDEKHNRKSPSFLLQHQFVQMGKVEAKSRAIIQKIGKNQEETAAIFEQQITRNQAEIADLREKNNYLSTELLTRQLIIEEMKQEQANVRTELSNHIKATNDQFDALNAKLSNALQTVERLTQQIENIKEQGRDMEKAEGFRSELETTIDKVNYQADRIDKMVKLSGGLLLDENKVFWTAIKNDYTEALENAILEGADPNSRHTGDQFKFKTTALIAAATLGHRSSALLLLDRGAEIDATDTDGLTAVARAAEHNHVDCLEALLNRGADVEARGSYGSTPLVVAARSGHRDCVKLLITRRAKVDVEDNYGKTALIHAIEEDHAECVGMLLEHGANAEKKYGGRRIEGTGREETEANGLTPLAFAAKKGRVNCLKVLIEKGASLNAVSDNCTALTIAAINGHLDCVKLLTGKGADVNLREMNGDWTALASAASHGDLACVQWLVRNGADVNAELSHGRAALHVAAEKGHLSVVRFLVDEAGAKVNMRDEFNQTPLKWAVRKRKQQVVTFLKLKGATE